MRMAFGLVGILVAIGVIVWIISAVEAPSMQQAANVNKNVRPQVEQISGHGTDGEDARQSIKLDGETTNGKMTGVLVTAITTGGPMESYFGLKRGDVIVEISMQGDVMMPVSGMTSAAEAKDYLLSSFQNRQHITVMRDDKKVTLPVAGAKPAAPAGGADSGSPLQKQLDGIKVPQ